MTIFISYPISKRDTHISPRVDMGHDHRCPASKKRLYFYSPKGRKAPSCTLTIVGWITCMSNYWYGTRCISGKNWELLSIFNSRVDKSNSDIGISMRCHCCCRRHHHCCQQLCQVCAFNSLCQTLEALISGLQCHSGITSMSEIVFSLA